MKLLFLLPQLPFPPHKGTAIRNFHVLKNLARHNALTILTFCSPGAPAEAVAAREVLGDFCPRVVLVPEPRRSRAARLCELPFPNRPDLAWRLRSSAMERCLSELLEAEQFDLVQVEGLEMALHWQAARRANSSNRLPKAILDDHNAEYVLQQRAYQIDRRVPAKWPGALYSLVQWRKLIRFERLFCQVVGGVVAASEHDRRALLDLDPRLRIAVVPNGVDVDGYSAVGRAPASEPRVVFTGTMNFRPNVDGVEWLCREVWPAVQRALPEATLWIVGRDPKPEIARRHDGHHVFVTGAVSDVRPYLASAWLSVVPLRIGGGSRLKVLESMAAGVPVVSTTLGCEGIAVTPDTARIADRPAELAASILGLLEDKGRRRKMAAEARKLVVAHYDWRAIVPRLAEFQREVLAA